MQKDSIIDQDITKDALNQFLIEKSESSLDMFSSELRCNEADFEELKVIELQLYQLKSPQEIQKFINSSKFLKSKNIKILDTSQEKLSSDKNILLVYNIDMNYWALEFDNTKLEIVEYLFHILYENFKRFYQADYSMAEVKLWKKVFSYIDIPVVLLNNDDEIAFYNSKFVGLNFSQSLCRDLKNNHQLEILGQNYRVQLIEIAENNEKLIYFLPIKEELIAASTSSEELGIVSSSLAHELNNPLAGILAALSVLELDEHSHEFNQKISEMKSTTMRCKKLVETFLGFSKVEQSNYEASKDIKHSFEQALELMRFRIIENNIKFEINYLIVEKQDYNFNPAVISMLLYLVLGEILTSFSHYFLVAEKMKDKICLNVSEHANGMKIKWADPTNVNESLSRSKLIQHLLESQNAKASFSEGVEIEFS